jgi:pseudouridine synthase
MNQIRLQLFLAKAGIASRRHAEALIVRGRISVNGHVVTQLGTRVDPATDRIWVDGKLVEPEPLAYYLLHKPKGYVTTAADPDGRPTVFDLLKNVPVRVFPVGRLDFNTEGVLLLTNDGELAHALMHPSRGVEKVYHAKFREELTQNMLSRLRQGVELPPPRILGKDGVPLAQPAPLGPPERSAPAEVRVLKFTSRHTWAEIRLHEGKNRQIHRMAEAVGSSVLKLTRVQYAGLSAEGVEMGESRPLSAAEVKNLRLLCGLAPAPGRPLVPPTQKKQKTPSTHKPPARRAEAEPPYAKPDFPRAKPDFPRAKPAGHASTRAPEQSPQPASRGSSNRFRPHETPRVR